MGLKSDYFRKKRNSFCVFFFAHLCSCVYKFKMRLFLKPFTILKNVSAESFAHQQWFVTLNRFRFLMIKLDAGSEKLVTFFTHMIRGQFLNRCLDKKLVKLVEKWGKRLHIFLKKDRLRYNQFHSISD